MPEMLKKYIHNYKGQSEEYSFMTPSQYHLQKPESRKIVMILSILGFAILLVAGMNNVLFHHWLNELSLLAYISVMVLLMDISIVCFCMNQHY